MREIIVMTRKIVTENGKTILYERKIRGSLNDDGAFRLLSYYGRRVSVPQQERSGHAKSA